MSVNQTSFRTAVLDPDLAHPIGLTDGEGAAAGRRFDVYRNNVVVSLTEALETAFPVIQKLLGAQNFKIVASAFLRAHPPKSPLMMFYGSDFPDFLKEFEPTASTHYLPDVACLELALRQSYHSADATPSDPSVLQHLKPDELMAVKLTLAPSVKLIRSTWPIYSIWKFNTEPGAEKPQMAPEDVVVVRPEFDPHPVLLPEGGGRFIAALLQDLSLEDALAAVDNTNFDLANTLSLLIENNSISNIGT